MKIIGFGLTKIHADKKNPIKGKLEISAKTQISNISEEKSEFLKDSSLLKFSFEFEIEYKPEIANIAVEGYVLVSLDKKEAKETLKKWNAKELGDEIRSEIINFVISRVSLKTLQIEEEFDLPYHIPFPRVAKKEDKA